MSGLTKLDETIAAEREKLIELSKSIFDRPELGLEEYYASEVMCQYLESEGFNVTRGVGGLDTAYVASYEEGTGGYHVAYCAEYDALPEIGHACGHNLIGVASIAAGVALAECLKGNKRPFKVSIIGTPDEEGTGGKVDLIHAGVFNDVNIAMMFHPGYSTIIHVESLAFHSYEFIFKGKTAHAASEPWEGRNALDGVIQMFNGVNALRQQVKSDVRIHGIIKEGGLVTNIIPERAVAEFCVRSIDNEYLNELAEKLIQCAKGAALMSGTELEVLKVGHFYEAMRSNTALEQVYRQCLDEVGYIDRSRHKEGMGSIDMGNVSNVVPSIHPVLSLTDRLVPGHTVEFAEMCNTDHAYETMLLAGKSMALTGYQVVIDPSLQKKIQEEFESKNTQKSITN
jgi:amidohydrolase